MDESFGSMKTAIGFSLRACPKLLLQQPVLKKPYIFNNKGCAEAAFVIRNKNIIYSVFSTSFMLLTASALLLNSACSSAFS